VFAERISVIDQQRSLNGLVDLLIDSIDRYDQLTQLFMRELLELSDLFVVHESDTCF
jgi:hypothetical protein